MPPWLRHFSFDIARLPRLSLLDLAESGEGVGLRNNTSSKKKVCCVGGMYGAGKATDMGKGGRRDGGDGWMKKEKFVES